MSTKAELTTALENANEILRSAHSIADRNGERTNWTSFKDNVQKALFEQHRILVPDHDRVCQSPECLGWSP